jgi:hypothetical protein
LPLRGEERGQPIRRGPAKKFQFKLINVEFFVIEHVGEWGGYGWWQHFIEDEDDDV